jgi:hypothetical protein
VAGGGVEGVARLRATLDTAARELADLHGADVHAGQLLAQAGAARAPRDRGVLAESHGFTITDSGFEVVAAAPYAAYVHAVNPWLVREFDAQTETIIDIYADSVADAVAHVKGA